MHLEITGSNLFLIGQQQVVLDRIDLLARSQRMGIVIPKASRIRKVVHSPFVIYYQVAQNKGIIEALHLRHGARKAPGIGSTI